jgi:hypothetical protein
MQPHRPQKNERSLIKMETTAANETPPGHIDSKHNSTGDQITNSHRYINNNSNCGGFAAASASSSVREFVADGSSGTGTGRDQWECELAVTSSISEMGGAGGGKDGGGTLLRKHGHNYLANAVRSVSEVETLLALISDANTVGVYQYGSGGAEPLRHRFVLQHSVGAADVIRDICWSPPDYKFLMVAVAFATVVFIFKLPDDPITNTAHYIDPFHIVHISAQESVASISWMYCSIPTVMIISNPGSTGRVVELPRASKREKVTDLLTPKSFRGRGLSVSVRPNMLLLIPQSESQPLIQYDDLALRRAVAGQAIHLQTTSSNKSLLVSPPKGSKHLRSLCTSPTGDFIFIGTEDEGHCAAITASGESVSSVASSVHSVGSLILSANAAEPCRSLISVIRSCNDNEGNQTSINSSSSLNRLTAQEAAEPVMVVTSSFRRTLPGQSMFDLGSIDDVSEETLKVIPKVNSGSKSLTGSSTSMWLTASSPKSTSADIKTPPSEHCISMYHFDRENAPAKLTLCAKNDIGVGVPDILAHTPLDDSMWGVCGFVAAASSYSSVISLFRVTRVEAPLRSGNVTGVSGFQLVPFGAQIRLPEGSVSSLVFRCRW